MYTHEYELVETCHHGAGAALPSLPPLCDGLASA
jgi:hypothetical protein